eukprot:TRINITY_DN18757_c0_g1_i1.p1 TRINITY_DN18757_c0_g1~~TRINITY_DN18757_c0_g1_i1.p1  ORF type:complete len:508 (-),score=116.22 TRINITY_DN18757_c0_g1_i1:23-1546(-)
MATDIYKFWADKRRRRRGVPLLKRFNPAILNNYRDLDGPLSAEDMRKAMPRLLMWRRQLETARMLIELINKRELQKYRSAVQMRDIIETTFLPVHHFAREVLEQLEVEDVGKIMPGVTLLPSGDYYHSTLYSKKFTSKEDFMRELDEMFTDRLSKVFEGSTEWREIQRLRNLSILWCENGLPPKHTTNLEIKDVQHHSQNELIQVSNINLEEDLEDSQTTNNNDSPVVLPSPPLRKEDSFTERSPDTPSLSSDTVSFKAIDSVNENESPLEKDATNQLTTTLEESGISKKKHLTKMITSTRSSSSLSMEEVSPCKRTPSSPSLPVNLEHTPSPKTNLLNRKEQGILHLEQNSPNIKAPIQETPSRRIIRIESSSSSSSSSSPAPRRKKKKPPKESTKKPIPTKKRKKSLTSLESKPNKMPNNETRKKITSQEIVTEAPKRNCRRTQTRKLTNNSNYNGARIQIHPKTQALSITFNHNFINTHIPPSKSQNFLSMIGNILPPASTQPT